MARLQRTVAAAQWNPFMSKTIIVHSFHHGVGRSNLTANLSFLLAAEGRRVGLIDTDTHAPASHWLFGIDEQKLRFSFNDYLLGKCEIEQTAHDITTSLGGATKGSLFLVPAKLKVCETPRILSDPQDVHLLNTGCQRLIDRLDLDALFIDTQPGLSDEALVSITMSDTLVIILRLNPSDYHSTGVTVDVVRQLEVPRVMLIVNEAPLTFDFTAVSAELEQAYGCEVIAVIPHVDEMMALANNDIFVRRYPDHLVTFALKQAVTRLVS